MMLRSSRSLSLLRWFSFSRSIRWFVFGLLACVGFWTVQLNDIATAQLAYQLQIDGLPAVNTRYVDVARKANSWAVYTPAFGFSTRTNQHGIDVSALKTNEPHTYRVADTSEHRTCLRQAVLEKLCGDQPIPQNGLVLSAHGAAKKNLAGLVPGTVFRLVPQWFASETRAINVVNPKPANNARFCGFPGCRGSGQLIVYTRDYGHKRTGTNEFGFEVTVVDGMVVAQEGSDSYIPEKGYVLSGHGSSRNWLIDHAPLGARMMMDPEKKNIESRIDVWTYRYQLARRYDDAVHDGHCVNEMGQVFAFCRKVQRVLDELAQADVQQTQLPSDESRAELATNTLQWFQEQLWQQYPHFVASSKTKKPIQGIWHRPVEMSRGDVAKTLEFFRNSGINTVFLETFYHGYTLFPSETMVTYGLPKQHPSFAVLNDPLQVWLEEAHQRGMSIHPWIETFYAGNQVAPPSSDSKMGPILNKYPDWANVAFKDRFTGHISPSPLETGSYFLDPYQPDVQEFLLTLMTELVNRYDIDGLQLDYIRHPSAMPEGKPGHLGSSWGYTAAARRAFYQQRHVDPAQFTLNGIQRSQKKAWAQWKQFKNDSVSRFVHEISLMTHGYNQTNPEYSVILSAAVFPKPSESLGRKHQDWPLWVRKKWLDAIVPITLTSAIKVVDSDIKLVRSIAPSDVQVISGVFGAFNQNTPDHLLGQIEAARFRGANGFSVFDSAHLTGKMGRAMSMAYRGS